MSQKSRWLLRLGLGFVLFVVLVVGAHWFMGRRAEKALGLVVAEIAGRGEPTRVEDLKDEPVAAEENAAVELREAAGLIDRGSTVWTRFDRLEPRLPLREKEQAAMEAAVKEHAESLKLVRLARAKPKAAWGMVFSSPMILTLMPELSEQRDLANLAAAEMLLAHERGEHGEVVERGRDILAMGRAMQRMPTLIAYLVGQGEASMAAKHTGEAAVGLKIGNKPGDASPEQVERLIAELLDETWARQGLVRALKVERVQVLDVIAAMRAGTMVAPVPGGSNAQGPQAAMRTIAYVGKPAILKDTVQVMGYFDATIRQVETASNWPAVNQGVPQRTAKPSMMRMASLMTPSLKRSAESYFAILAERRLAATALAIRLYASEHEGKLPATLEELVPRYLPAVPVDPMLGDGSVMRYVVQKEKPVVYSVGKDGRDDGGVENEIRSKPNDIVVHLTRQERVKEEKFEEEEFEEEEVEQEQ